MLWKKLTCCRISIKTMKIKSIFLLVNSREDVSVRWSYDVYIAAQRMFSTQTISIQTRSVCIHNRNTTFFNHLPIRQTGTTICWIIIIGHWIRIACREMSDYLSRHWGRCWGDCWAHNSIIKPGHCWSGSETVTVKPRLSKSGLSFLIYIHVLWFDILGCYFGIILPYFGMKIKETNFLLV